MRKVHFVELYYVNQQMHKEFVNTYLPYVYNQQDAQNSCSQTLFFNIRSTCMSYLLCARRIHIYQIRHTTYKKIAPEDGLIESETCTAYIEK